MAKSRFKRGSDQVTGPQVSTEYTGEYADESDERLQGFQRQYDDLLEQAERNIVTVAYTGNGEYHQETLDARREAYGEIQRELGKRGMSTRLWDYKGYQDRMDEVKNAINNARGAFDASIAYYNAGNLKTAMQNEAKIYNPYANSEILQDNIRQVDSWQKELIDKYGLS